MLNYIRAEVGRVLKRKYFWNTVLIPLIIAALGCWGMIYMNHHGMNAEQTLSLEHYLMIGIGTFSAAVYLLIMFVDMITMEEIKNNTIKNIVSSGLLREKIYLGKEISLLVTSLIAMVIVLGGSLLIGYIFLGINSPETVIQYMKTMGICLVGCIFLWSGAACMLHFLGCFIKNGVAGTLIYVVLFVLLEDALNMLGEYISPIFNAINRIWLGTQIDIICNTGTVEAMIEAILVGMGYIVVFSILGSILFKRLDV